MIAAPWSSLVQINHCGQRRMRKFLVKKYKKIMTCGCFSFRHRGQKSISPPEQDGFLVCKALHDDQRHHWRDCDKSQNCNRPLWRPDVRWSPSPLQPLPLGGACGGKRMNIAHLVVMMADCTSETWCSLANDASSRPTVLYRPEIYAVLAEISNMCHFGPCGIFRKTLPHGKL